MKRLLPFSAMVVVVAAFSASVPAPEFGFTPRVHRYHNAPVGYLNAYVVETATGSVVIDAGFLVGDGRGIRAIIDSLGKPLQAILITHGHPDHYNGAGIIRGSDSVPVIATAAVARVIRKDDELKESWYRPAFGDAYPADRVFPTRVAAHGESFEFGDVVFTVHDLGPGESDSDAYWRVTGGGRELAFIGDVVLNGVHAFFQDGHTKAWLDELDGLRDRLVGVDGVYPGHGEPGGVEMLEWQSAYIRRYRRVVRELAAGGSAVPDSALPILRERMTEFLPNDRLGWAIPVGAEVVAAELALESAQGQLIERMWRFSSQ